MQAPAFDFIINHEKHGLMMGSCFTDNVGLKLQNYKYPALVNPFGVQYNPMSVLKGLQRIRKEACFSREDLLQFQGRWLSFYHDTGFSNPDAEEAVENINASLRNASKVYEKSDYMLITFGTAWVYAFQKTGEIVSNCHKIPAKEFTRRRLTVEEITISWEKELNTILRERPETQFVFTVSPVRHWKDGPFENQLSKATLLLAIEKLCNVFDQVHYFPAYEIMMDDLRDYRFYKTDLLHPNDMAVAYIWERFKESFLSPGVDDLHKKLDALLQARNHRIYDKKSSATKQFANKQLADIDRLEKELPKADFKEEKDYFHSLSKA